MTSTAYLAGEALAEPLRPHRPPPVSHVTLDAHDTFPIPDDFSGLERIAGDICALFAQSTRLPTAERCGNARLPGRRLGGLLDLLALSHQPQQWVAWYRQGGLALVKARKRGGKGKACRLSPQQKAALVDKARTEGFVSVKDAVRFVTEQFGIVYSESGMGNLFADLALRKKVPRPRNAKACQEVQADFQKRG